MPILDITEYVDSSHGNPIEPPMAHQVVPLGAEPAQSQPLHKDTRIVRLIADADCRVGFGERKKASFLPAGREMIRVIGGPMSLSATLVEQPSEFSGDRFDALLALIANPAACAKRKTELQKLEALVRQKGEALASGRADFTAASTAHAQAVAIFAKEKSEFEALFTEQDADLKAREAALAQAKSDFERDSKASELNLARREADVTKREDAVADRARLVREDEAKIAGVLTDLERRRSLLKSALE